MKLWAISDLHLDFEENRLALKELPPHYKQDWLIVAGDIGHRPADLDFALDHLQSHFAQVIWVPGNHDLWTASPDDLKGVEKYFYLVKRCQSRGVLTPEDPFPRLTFQDQTFVIAPLFLLYDYSFRPDDVPLNEAIHWAMAQDILCADENYLDPSPYADLIYIRIPRFSIWCGTRRTEDWIHKFPVSVAVNGHLHVRSTQFRGGVRFEEVSLGYPRNWKAEQGMAHYLRLILPWEGTPNDEQTPIFHR